MTIETTPRINDALRGMGGADVLRIVNVARQASILAVRIPNRMTLDTGHIVNAPKRRNRQRQRELRMMKLERSVKCHPTQERHHHGEMKPNRIVPDVTRRQMRYRSG